jgi:hypothetical protein
VTPKQRQVPGVGSRHDIEEVTQERNRPEDQVDDGIHDHPGDDHAGNAEPGGFRDQPEADDARHGVPDHRNEPDDRIEADPDAGSGHGDEVVEDAADQREALLERAEPGGSIVTDDVPANPPRSLANGTAGPTGAGLTLAIRGSAC